MSRHSRLIHQVIAEQAARSPELIAVEYDGDRLTYGELWGRAQRLAARLRAEGAGPDSVVAVALERSMELPVAVLAVLVCGAAYLPLDSDYPPRRLAFMLADSGARLLLTRERLRNTLPEFAGSMVRVDDDHPASGSVFDTHPDCLAYVIYTSGSTGIPKAAMNTHRAIANRLAWMQDEFRLTFADRVLHKTPIGFDVSVWELFWPLMYGATLVLAKPGGHRDPFYLVEVIRQEKVTVLHFVPSMLRAFLAAPDVGQCSSIRNVICSGEALAADLSERFFERLPGTRLHNLYGPTEAAVDVTAWECAPGDTEIRIGSAITNARAHVVDEERRPLSAGQAGELLIGGVALARGYLGKPGLTAERFVPDHLSGRAGARLYLTGDRARWRDDGMLEYLGRMDDQVKIRGVRIEPAEVAAVLAQHDGVADAVVLASQDRTGQPRLIAYAIPDRVQARPVLELLRMEREDLPAPAVRHDLPDGRTVLVPSQSEADFLDHEVFDAGRYSALGIDPSPSGCVIDAGAHVGLFTFYASGGGAAVYAFEPVPPLFELLRRNTAMHDIDARLFPWALGDADGDVMITYYPNLSIMSGRYADRDQDSQVMRAFLGNSADLEPLLDWGLRARHYTRPVRRLSTVLRELGIDQVDLLKIDVEKSEEDVLAGVDESDWPKVRQLLVEVHDLEGRLDRLTAALEHRGFRVATGRDPQLDGTSLVMLAAVRRDGLSQKPADRRPQATWASPSRLVADLRRQVRQSLPEAMTPSAFVLVDEFPVTPNGKLDRRALPAPDARLALTSSWTAPEGKIQVQLAAFWTELLGRDKPGADDDFFELGGHSLLASQLVARVRTALGVELALDAVFEGRTIRRIAREVAVAPPSAHEMPGLRRVPRDDGELPLSVSQQRLWYLQQVYPGIRAYQFQAVIEFTGTLDRRALPQALTEIVRRHEAYRTTFVDGFDGPQQVVHPPFEVELPADDLCDAPDPEAQARALIEAAIAEEIAVDRLPLIRWRLLQTAADRHILLHLEHHLIHDGWAFNVFIGELQALYLAYVAGEPSPLAEPELQFADFAVWQRAWLDGPVSEQQLSYWRRTLDGVAEHLDLPADRPRTALRRFIGAAPRYEIPAETAAAVRGLARDEHVTLFTTMLAAFQVLLSRWSGQDDFCIGSGFANRRWRQAEQLFGMVINTVPLRADLRGDPTLRELLRRAHATVLGASANQDVPFDRVVAAMRPQRVAGRQPLCQVMFAFHDAPIPAVKIPGLELNVIPGISNGSAKFDLNIIVIPRAEQAFGLARRFAPGEIELIWEYDSDLFDALTMERMVSQYRRLLDAIAASPQARVSELLMDASSPALPLAR